MSIKKVTRRDFLKQASMLAGATALAACTPTTGPSAAGPATLAPMSKSPLTLTVWCSDWGKAYNDPMVKLSDAFSKDMAANIKVEWTFLPKMADKLSAAVAGGNPPDVSLVDDTYSVPKLGKLGGVLDLTSFYNVDGIKESDFIAFTWPTVANQGKIYGMPGGVGAQALLINNAVFKDAGIDPATIPDTPSWGQFVEWNQKCQKKDANGKLIRVGANSTGMNQQYFGILGFEYYNADVTKLACNSPKSVDALNKWKSLLPQGVPFDDVSKLIGSAPNAPSYAALGAGIQGIENDGYWCFLVLDTYFKNFDYTVTKLPTPNGTKDEWNLYTGWVWDMVIPKGSKHVTEGWEFIKYGFWSHGEMLADTLNWTSALARFPEFIKRTEVLMKPDSPTLKGLHHFSEMQYGGKYTIPYTSIHTQYVNALGAAYDEIVRTGKDTQAAMDGVVKTLQPALDKFVAEG